LTENYPIVDETNPERSAFEEQPEIAMIDTRETPSFQVTVQIDTT
jgi:hypothetical protein